jgi:hypothetical protein
MLKVYGQEVSTPEGIIKEKFRRYCESVPREEIYIHTDRYEYIAGEDIWFNIYLIDRQKNILTDHSSVVYFELVNPDNIQIIEKRIRLDKGLGPGHIQLPDTLSTGRYIIRAYTAWMRNFLPENCFVREFLIYNALSNRTLKGKPGYDAARQLAAGGNKTAMEADAGIEIKVSREQSGRTEITLMTDDRFRSGNNNKYYLLVQTHGVINLVRTVNLNSGTIKTNVPEEIFTPGINQIVVFNSELKPLTERLIYTPFKQEEDLKINSADTFRTREKVEITIGSDMAGSESFSASAASISVVMRTGRTMYADIADYMVFGSEFGLLPESFINRRISEIPCDSVNMFLLNTKSSWIDWNSVMSGRLPELQCQAEKDRHFITGQLIQKNTKVPLTGKYMFMSVPGKTATFQYSKTDSTGTFSFALPLNDEVIDMVIQPEEPDLKSSVMIGMPFTGDILQNSDNPDTSIASIPEYLSKWGINYQVGKIYGINYTAEPLPVSLNYTGYKRVYGKPDIELLMKDYIMLPLMEEVFFELTPGVQLRRKRTAYSMTIEDPVTGRIHEKPPVLFIDGVVVKDPAIVAGLDPETVEKIDVIKDLYLVGDYMFFGIINVITKAGDLSGISLPEDAIRFKYRAVEPVPSFRSPDYSSEDTRRSRIPDFRNTLYWSPSIISPANGNQVVEFWTSDEAGSFEINLQGMNNKGKPVSFRKVITVR